jgi:glutamate 5-kinase
MVNLVRREVVETAHIIVVKVGTNVLSCDDDSLDVDRIADLAEQIHHIRDSGRRVVIVSSGAVGAGLSLLGLNGRPEDLPHLQAAAAAGQTQLIHLYDKCLRRYGYHAAQLLLTADDFTQRDRYLNVRNTLTTLFEYGAVPVINENDTVSIDEIKFGDNDRLAAMVTNLLHAPLLIILSVVDGLYDGDPKHPDSRLIPLVDHWDDSLFGYVAEEQSKWGTGGMRTKLDAVRTATAVGGSVILASGTRPNVLDIILAGEEVGTLFLAKGAAVPAWKRWIGYAVLPKGRYVLDDGARAAIVESGRSLLAIGITGVNGEFSKGEVVALVDADGKEFARGLTNYDSAGARIIIGKRTEEIIDLFGVLPYSEVIHRDHLVVTG